jgi:serine/threonine protein kinase/tetratricopeptide (TPR) repeat protein
MPLAVGTHLGPYEILAPLGAGGMGDVYRSRDPRLNREVAIKVLPERLAGDPQALARFESEAKAVAALSHPNILAIFDVGADQGVTYAVTELLEGETLRSHLGRAALPWRKAVEVGAAISDGLATAHSKGIIHRDLKPENLFLTSDGRVKILDFGLARWTPSSSSEQAEAATLTQENVVLGTVGYMSPEQVRAKPVDARSDIFSLGCVLYEMVVGRRAFSRETSAQTMAAILEAQPPELETTGKPALPALENVIAHCLEKNPQQRFHSAHDLALALRAILGGSEPARPIPARSLPVRWMAAGVAVLALVAVAYWFAGRAKPIDSLAVMPFVNVGADLNTEYLSDGITENLINNLSQLPQLRVLPRGRVFPYKGRETDAEKIGRELNVRAVLSGRVAQRGDSLNIQTELVEVATGSQLWGQQFDRKFTEILAVQEEIGRQVSQKLRLRPTGEEQKRMGKRSTENTEAYQLYLKGRYYWNRRTADLLKKANEYFQQAIDKDPSYGLAYAGLAESYALFNFYEVLPPSESCPKAKAAAMTALGIDETLAETHNALGWIKMTCDWDWPGSEREFKRALEINPNYGQARMQYGAYFEAMGRSNEAIAERRRALEADPLSLIISAVLGRALHFARHYDQAMEELRKTLDMDPGFAQAHFFLGWVYEQKGMFAEAIAELRQGLSGSGGAPRYVSALGHAYAISGQRRMAEQSLALLQEQAKQRYVAPSDMAEIHIGLGEKEQALKYLEMAYQDHSCWMIWLRVDPRFDAIRGDPRYLDLLRRMHLTP